MCQAKPGKRCFADEYKRFAAAQESGDKERINQAQQNLDATAHGMYLLEESILGLDFEKNEKEVDELLERLKIAENTTAYRAQQYSLAQACDEVTPSMVENYQHTFTLRSDEGVTFTVGHSRVLSEDITFTRQATIDQARQKIQSHIGSTLYQVAKNVGMEVPKSTDKGGAGKIVEFMLGGAGDNLRITDLQDYDIKSGVWIHRPRLDVFAPQEPIKITTFSPVELLNDDFENSHVFSKSKMFYVPLLRQEKKGDIYDSEIGTPLTIDISKIQPLLEHAKADYMKWREILLDKQPKSTETFVHRGRTVRRLITLENEFKGNIFMMRTSGAKQKTTGELTNPALWTLKDDSLGAPGEYGNKARSLYLKPTVMLLHQLLSTGKITEQNAVDIAQKHESFKSATALFRRLKEVTK